MATPEPRRYEPEELLALAKSPLVKKPSTLPPIEEWMGPVIARPTASRARTDGDLTSNSNGNDDSPRGAMTNRRPSIFSDSRLSRSSIPEDMVLGPPKMSFASSSARTSAGNKFDHESVRNASLNTPTFDDERGESPRFDRFKSFGGFARGEERDKESGGRDFSDFRGGFSKRREDSEGGGWTSVSRQPRKSFGTEDGGDRERFRKDMRGDTDKKGGSPWDRERPAKYENFGKERDREHRGRGKRDESSWLLEDNRGERNNRDNQRDHHRFGSRVEKDPEWMDSDGKSGDGKAAHSMEDFQKWKERMKASSAGPAEPYKKPEDLIEKVVQEQEQEPVPEPAPEPPVVEEKQEKAEKTQRQESNPRDDSEGGVFLDRANERGETEPIHAAENGVDRFFGFWSGNSILKSPEQSDILSAPRAEPRVVGKSRFTSFFGPQESQSPPPHAQVKEHHQIPVNRTPPYAQSPARDSANTEDREGFQRILKMLGTTNINGPGSSDSLPSGLLSRPPQSSISPGISSMSSHPPPPQVQHGHQQYPMQNPGRDSNTDFLMRLMRGEQPPLPPPPQQQQQHQSGPMHSKYGGPSQMPPPPPIDTSILQFNRGNHNPISPNIDDPAVMFRHRPNQDSSNATRGPLHMMVDYHAPPSGWNPQQASQAPPPQSHRQVAPPPGFTGARHQQGPPPPFLPPPGVSGPPVPFQLLNGLNGPLPPNIPPPPHFLMGGMNGMGGINGINGMNGGPPPLPSNMNGPPQGGFPGMQFPPHHHPDAMLGGIHSGPPFGFPHHDGLKSPPFGHGPNKGIMR